MRNRHWKLFTLLAGLLTVLLFVPEDRSRIGKNAMVRVELSKGGESADITCAMNFSYCVFKTRDLLGPDD